MQLSDRLGITLPITSEFRRVADAFALQCPIREKAERIRRNTLAVCLVNSYLQMMDIPTDVANSDSWQPMIQIMSDVADLQLPEVGTLSCRAIAPNANTCYIPPEEWHHRIGYVAVALDEPNRQAKLIGFTPSASEQTEIPLSQFAALETLIDSIHALQPSDRPAARPTLTQLGQWTRAQLDEIAKTGWQAVEQLLASPAPEFAFRSVRTIEPTAVDISRAKLVNLGIQLDRTIRVALVIQIVRPLAGEGDPPQTHITFQVHPVEEATRLPESLSLSIIDKGRVIASTAARDIDNFIQLQLSGEAGEQFSVQIKLGESSFEEQFAI